ncbi:ATP-binding protein [Oceanibium sediminis]|uniref:ATP-binding protein n=1 Tax=Oceanibium sediminis TaxID=2026339 RepID=UPI000DD2B7A0|nr:ATP-binding protein [Oceanibium sediminis]
MPVRSGTLAWLAFACVAIVLVGGTLGLGPLGETIAILGVFGLAVALGASGRAPVPDQAPARDAPPLPGGFGQALLQRLPAPLIVVGQDRRLTYVNPAAHGMLPQARVGAHYSNATRAPGFIEAVESVLRDGRDRSFTFTQLQDQERHYEARASYLPEGAGGAFGDGAQVLVLIEDRTRDKAMLQTRSDFVANASHELRTPLASILGYIETLQGHARDDPEARELFLGIMLQQASRMQRLVDDLMSLNRIELNAHQRPEARIPLRRTVAEAAEALFPLASRSDVLLMLDLDLDQGDVEVLADRDQISQVTVNLIDNAIKYGRSGGRVRVVPAEKDPRFPGMTGVSVIDEGPGIAREHIPRITERFYRVSNKKSAEVGGTGLGLAIIKHIMTRHGGTLDIQSKPGEGSRFTIWLPLALESGDSVGASRNDA